MNYNYRITDKYYDGFQKLSLFSEMAFRRVVLISFITAIGGVAVAFFFTGTEQETADALLYIAVACPLVLIAAGGMTSSAWKWHIAFSLFAAAAIAGNIFIGSVMLSLLIPAAISLAMLVKTAPKTFAALGYIKAGKKKNEAAFALVTSAIFIIVTYSFMSVARGASLEFLSFERYLAFATINLVTYGPMFGLIYGALMRRLLDCRFELSVAVTLNAIFVFVMWAPRIVGSDDPMTYISASLAACMLTQITLGLAFYFCRSTRMVFVSYLLYYLFYKSLVF